MKTACSRSYKESVAATREDRAESVGSICSWCGQSGGLYPIAIALAVHVHHAGTEAVVRLTNDQRVAVNDNRITE